MYTYSQLGITEMTNLYLFGQPTTPENLKDNSLIRDFDAITTISVDAVSFMAQGAGRFAFASNSPLVSNFINGAIAPGTPDKRTVYSLDELMKLTGLEAKFKFQAYNYSDGTNDFGTRVHVWNTEGFTISRDAKFVVEADGTRHIEKLAVLPFDENFDFDSTSDFAEYGAYLTRPGIDPSDIGRRVDIIFDQISKDLVPRVDYTAQSFIADKMKDMATYSPVSGVARLLPEMGMVLNELNNTDVTKFVDNGRVIRYDEHYAWSTRAPNISDEAKALYGLSGGVTMVADNRGGNLLGSKYSDELLGGNGDDRLDGGEGSDYLVGGKGDDRLSGSYGADLIRGGDGDDTIRGGEDINSLYGDAGDDDISAVSNSKLYGGSGNDYLYSGENSRLEGGAGIDEYRAGKGSVIYADSLDSSIRASDGPIKLYIDGHLITESMLLRKSGDTYATIGGLTISGFLDPNIVEPLDGPAIQIVGQATTDDLASLYA